MRRVPESLSPIQQARGFTLVEMIIAIVITGILAGMVMMFGWRQISAYIDVGNRAEMADAADTALRRIARDLQTALPNSVRQPASGSTKFLEYVPIRDAGRYRADFGGNAADDPLDLGSTTDNSFEVLGPPVTIRSGDQLVIFNLGQAGSDVHAGTSRRAITTAPATVSSIQFALGTAPNQQFPLASPQSRFQIVGGPVTYECAENASTPELGTVIRHWCYDFQQSGAPTAFGALTKHAACSAVQSAVLVSDVKYCNFTYTPAVQQRNGLVVLRLTLSKNNESVELLHQVEVLNTP